MSGKTTTLTTRVPETLAAAVEAVAHINGLSVGALVREAVEQWLVSHVSLEKLQADLEAAAERHRVTEERRAQLATAGVRETKERAQSSAGKPAANAADQLNADNLAPVGGRGHAN